MSDNDLYECETTERILREEDGEYPKREKTEREPVQLKDLQLQMLDLKRAMYGCEIALRVIEIEPDNCIWWADLRERAYLLNEFASKFFQTAQTAFLEHAERRE